LKHTQDNPSRTSAARRKFFPAKRTHFAHRPQKTQRYTSLALLTPRKTDHAPI
jgi:hypothetical protein